MKKFKHFLGILLSGALLFALSACGRSAPPQSQAPAQNQESISAENSTEISPSEDSNPETAADAQKAEHRHLKSKNGLLISISWRMNQQSKHRFPFMVICNSANNLERSLINFNLNGVLK